MLPRVRLVRPPPAGQIGPALRQRGFQFAAHELGQCLRRHQIVAARRTPARAIRRYAAAGDEAMHVWMVDELLRPCVQHGEHADGAADVALVARQLDDRFGRGLHEGCVAITLV